MPEAKKTNTFIEKALLACKTPAKLHTKQRHSAALQNDRAKKPTPSLKNKFGLQNATNSHEI